MSQSQLKKWYDWISKKACLGCLAWPVEVAHFEGPVSNKTGQRLPRRKGAAKWAVVPLCVDCHRQGARSIHRIGEERWLEEHYMNRDDLLRQWSSWLVAFLEGENP